MLRFRLIFLCLVSLMLIGSSAHSAPPSPGLTPIITPVTTRSIPAGGVALAPHKSAAFEQMLAYVYQNNPQLVSEREALQVEDEHTAQAFSGFRPNLSVTGQAGRQREAIQGQDWLYGADVGGALVATQPLFNGFGTLEQFRAAKARVAAGRARLLAVEQQVLFSAIGVWLDLCEKTRVVAYNLDNLSRMYKYQEATESRFKAGDGTRTDIAQSQGRLAEAEAHYAQAEADLQSVQATYMRLTGERPPIMYFPPFPGGLPASAGETEEQARNHPELIQSRNEEEAAAHDVGAASSSLWPSVYLQGEMSESRSPELDLERLRDDSITLNVSIPLYQGGAEYSKVREAKILQEKTREAQMDTLAAVVERARQSWFNYTAARQVIGATQRAWRATAQALDGVGQEQAQGLRTTIDVLNAENEMLGTQIAEAQAEKNARLESYRLLASVGRLTAAGLGLPTVTYDPQPHYEDTATRAVGF